MSAPANNCLPSRSGSRGGKAEKNLPGGEKGPQLVVVVLEQVNKNSKPLERNRTCIKSYVKKAN